MRHTQKQKKSDQQIPFHSTVHFWKPEKKEETRRREKKKHDCGKLW